MTVFWDVPPCSLLPPSSGRWANMEVVEHLQCWLLSTRLHGAASQVTAIFILPTRTFIPAVSHVICPFLWKDTNFHIHTYKTELLFVYHDVQKFASRMITDLKPDTSRRYIHNLFFLILSFITFLFANDEYRYFNSKHFE
jgi:hypothetical protein